jgi:hypothetical protein
MTTGVRKTAGGGPPALNDDGSIDDPEFAEMKALTRAANAGDKRALRDLLARCKDRPKDLIWYGFGDLAKLVERSMLDAQLSNNPASWRAVEERMREIRRDLGVMTSSPLERLLISRIALAWLDVHVLDIHAAQNKDHRPKVVEALDRRRERADRRYMRAIKALAAVRKLNLTAVLINQMTIEAPHSGSGGSGATGSQG